ncbi:hypothetical protein PT974_01001 [Cladobotryum mycophilum]|uniref:Uncharacterized protein n=1 Tax=Cladobotryum mycophilum TaxID=491253 RepID=A0ABR0T2G9_9HYPO
MESNRIWHDPVVEIFSNLITQGACCSADAYDLANRRWYRLNGDAEVRDDDWLSSTIAKHIREYYAVNNEGPLWNTIRTTACGSPVTFETKPDDLVGRPITESPSYGSEVTDKLPITSFDQLESLTYISRSADRRIWRGKNCVFKRIEFNVGIEPIRDEIRIRETLIDATQPASVADVNSEIIRRFLITPVLAAVFGNSKPWKPGTVAGVPMPFSGQDLEILVREGDAALKMLSLGVA